MNNLATEWSFNCFSLLRCFAVQAAALALAGGLPIEPLVWHRRRAWDSP